MKKFQSTKLFDNYSIAIRQWRAQHSQLNQLFPFGLPPKAIDQQLGIILFKERFPLESITEVYPATPSTNSITIGWDGWNCGGGAAPG